MNLDESKHSAMRLTTVMQLPTRDKKSYGLNKQVNSNYINSIKYSKLTV